MADLVVPDEDSDYGVSSEVEILLGQLVADAPAPLAATTSTTESRASTRAVCLKNRKSRRRDVFPRHGTSGADAVPSESDRRRKIPQHAPDSPQLAAASTRLPDNDEIVSYPGLSKSSADTEPITSPKREVEEAEAGEVPAPQDTNDDSRSPLDRFRSYPRKPFSVSDLTAGSWCELQYFYTLTRLPYGKRTRTAAMKEGTRVHKDLEDEVHTTVRVEVTTREDAFGLKLWNLVQGLRTLRKTGLTRELEVWGFVDGNMVNGVIDGVSHQHPDPKVQEKKHQEKDARKSRSSITKYFPSQKTDNTKKPKTPPAYLTDVKTRGKPKPANTAQLRPAKVQLFLYHRFLADMAAGKLDFLSVFQRYNLDADLPFSDAFIAQMASMHEEEFFGDDSDISDTYVRPGAQDRGESSDKLAKDRVPEPSSSPDTLDFLKYKTLREMIFFVVSELGLAFPDGADSIGRLLCVEYRYRLDSSLIDSRVFPMDDRALDLYLSGTMEWWEGDREPRGVAVEDAWKCLVCEFAEDCTWRKAFDEDRLTRVRQRLASSRKNSSAV